MSLPRFGAAHRAGTLPTRPTVGASPAGRVQHRGKLRLRAPGLAGDLALLVSLVALLTLPSPVRAAPTERAAAACEAAYDAGEFDDATTCWTQLARSGHLNGHVLFNLGNTAHRAGRLGDAIAAYRGASALLPRDGDVAANLAAARALAVDHLQAEPANAAQEARAVRDRLAPTDWLWLWVLCSWLGFGGATAFLLRRIDGGKGLALTFVPLATCCAVAWYWQDHDLSARPGGVVRVDAVTVRSGKDARSVDLVELHQGAELVVTAWDERWALVEVPTGQRGWIARDAVAIVLDP